MSKYKKHKSSLDNSCSGEKSKKIVSTIPIILITGFKKLILRYFDSIANEPKIDVLHQILL